MRKKMHALCLIVVVVLLAVPAVAQAYDIAEYMLVMPGQYKIMQGEDYCTGSTSPQEAMLIRGMGAYMLEIWFEKVGNTWVREDIDILEITAQNVIYHGQYETEPGEEGLWLLNPPITIPRNLELNQPVVNQGIITHGSTSIPYTHTFMIIEAGVTVTTPAGTFVNCLKIAESDMEEQSVESEIMIWAPSVGEVKTWSSNVDNDTPDPVIETDLSQALSHGWL